MLNLMEDGFDGTLTNEPYIDFWEYYRDESKLLDRKLGLLLVRFGVSISEDKLNDYRGYFLSKEDAENSLKGFAQNGDKSWEADGWSSIREASEHIRLRKIASIKEGLFLPLSYLGAVFELTPAEEECILLAFLSASDVRYGKIMAYLQDDITMKVPTIDLAIRLIFPEEEQTLRHISLFAEVGKLRKFFFCDWDNKAGLSLNRSLVLDQRIMDFLVNTFRREDRPRLCREIFYPEEPLHDLCIQEDIQESLRSLFKSMKDGLVRGKLEFLHLFGPSGIGKRFQVKHLCKEQNENVMMVDAGRLTLSEEKFYLEWKAVCRESLLQQAFICLYHLDVLMDGSHSSEKRLEIIAEDQDLYGNLVFLLSQEELKGSNSQTPIRLFRIPMKLPDSRLRLLAWQFFTREVRLEDGAFLPELADKFRFTPGQILESIKDASSSIAKEGLPTIRLEDLTRCCYDRITHRLNLLSTHIKPAHGWSDIVLPDKELQALKSACDHIHHHHKVFYDWDFDKKLSYGKGLSMLFSGPPGTGKTMAAEVIAKELHMEMYKIQLSKIVSKFIGETEKNLQEIFDEAKKSNIILFFDESEAILGKRSDVKDAHDRYANIETAFLLQQMEEHDGITIMATNLLQNIDQAFLRRINYIIHFPFPDKEARKLIWEGIFPEVLPLDSRVDFDFLARKFEISGGNIKNIALSAAFLAASEGTAVTMDHLVKSSIQELAKSDKIILSSELEEYGDIVH